MSEPTKRLTEGQWNSLLDAAKCVDKAGNDPLGRTAREKATSDFAVLALAYFPLIVNEREADKKLIGDLLTRLLIYRQTIGTEL